MEISKEAAQRFFAEAGFVVEEIPESRKENEQRADLRVFYNQEAYLIEAKGNEKSTLPDTFYSSLITHRISNISRHVKPWNGISGKLITASKQLLKTPKNNTDFQIIFICALHEDSSFHLECIEKRLNGQAMLGFKKSNLSSIGFKPCYYYDYCDFPRMPHVHAAILLGPQGFRLLINTFCPNRTQFRNSYLYSLFSESLCDPEQQEKSGTAYLIGNDFKPNEQTKWQYLQSRYGVGTSRSFESHFKASILVTRGQ